MKRGILEVADLVVVNKADAAERERAERTAGELRGALSLFTRAVGGTAPEVVTASAVEERGVSELSALVVALHERKRESGALARRRKEGARAWLHEEIDAAIAERFRRGEARAELLAGLEREVEAGSITPRRAARRFLALAG
jgi:LAO/AO transport system kinase